LKILKQSTFQTQTEPDALKGVLVWFDEFKSLPIPYENWLQCQLALIEGFTNAVRHAHCNLPPETPIEIEVTVTTAFMDIKIWDFGTGFDFEAMLHRKLQTTTPDSEGGRGLKIMYQVADAISYLRTADRRNCLHIRKTFEGAIA
jgi:serine/threonine-protein kinase RsbW